jgi:hypothetical protein
VNAHLLKVLEGDIRVCLLKGLEVIESPLRGGNNIHILHDLTHVHEVQQAKRLPIIPF